MPATLFKRCEALEDPELNNLHKSASNLIGSNFIMQNTEHSLYKKQVFPKNMCLLPN